MPAAELTKFSARRPSHRPRLAVDRGEPRHATFRIAAGGPWIGRPAGTPLPGATGASLALPLLSRVFDLLPEASRPEASRSVTSVQEQHPRKATTAGNALHLLFPPSGAVLSADGPVTIRVMGGRRPLTFLVDGAPLPADRIRREAAWLPSGPGFPRLTVLDADGTAMRASVNVGATP